MPQIRVFDRNGQRLDELKVTIAYPRKRAPYKRFKILNLGREVPLASLTGLQAKVLLALLLSPSPLCVKEVAALVDCTTSAACRALTGLAIQGLVEKVARGIYAVNPDLAHYGRWTSQNRPRLQSRDGTA